MLSSLVEPPPRSAILIAQGWKLRLAQSLRSRCDRARLGNSHAGDWRAGDWRLDACASQRSHP
eukprot:15450031-Alexandrium_andersonii.AAC.1